jgi:RTX calcium-binding nonapeptide repeat (4 copies)
MRFIKMSKRAQLFGAVSALVVFAMVGTAYAALQGDENARTGQVLIGADNDEPSDPTIQPVPTPPGPDQSLKKADALVGGLGPDTIVGRLGSDVITAGAGNDVLVGGTEGGQPQPPLPNGDIAYGNAGSDAFIWAPGDGNDAFIGGEAAKVKKVKKGKKGKATSRTKKAAASAKKGKKGKKGKKKVRKPAPDVDTLVIGNLVLTADSSNPQLFSTPFGQLPRVFASDRGVPTPLGGTPPRNPNLTGSCEIVPAPAGLGFQHLVRFFGAPGNLAATMRVKGVEQVICPTVGSDAATLTSLGRDGAGPVTTTTTDFRAPAGSQLSAFVF